MDSTLSQAVQDYLKIIYKLSRRNGRATTSQIAESLAVKPASVTGMLRKLARAEPPLVEYEKHQGVTLTPAGVDAALETMRHHRLIELFLHEILGFPWDEVHDEAERLEHVISENMERRIAEVLGHPLRDPHGQLIPSRDLEISPTTEFPLGDIRQRQRAVVRRVPDEDPDLLRYLDQLGLRPGTHVRVLEYVPYDGTLRLQVGAQTDAIVLGPHVSERIFVDLLADAEPR